MKRLPLKPELLRAFLEGRKTVTRRLINQQPLCADTVEMRDGAALFSGPGMVGDPYTTRRPKYQPGDIVGIGEPWCLLKTWDAKSGKQVLEGIACMGGLPHTFYLNDGEKPMGMGRTRTGRFLPDALVRHKAKIVSVRAERLQEITLGEVVKEGLARSIYDFKPAQAGIGAFALIWDELHGKDAPWASNPWVFRYEIARVESEGGK